MKADPPPIKGSKYLAVICKNATCREPMAVDRSWPLSMDGNGLTIAQDRVVSLTCHHCSKTNQYVLDDISFHEVILAEDNSAKQPGE